MIRNTVLPFLLLVQLILGNGQMYDMSDGNDEGLRCPCVDGVSGRCKMEYANSYPGGPTAGLVYSTDIAASCIDVPDLTTITENSIFYMQVHVPYTQNLENMQVILRNDVTGVWLEWFKISGPIPENGRWMEFSVPLPPDINPGAYKVSIWDNANSNKISIRYFEIAEEVLCSADNF